MTRLLLARDSSVPDDPWNAVERAGLERLAAVALRVAAGEGDESPNGGPLLERPGQTASWTIDVDGARHHLRVAHRGSDSDPDCDRAFLTLYADNGHGHRADVASASVELHGVKRPVTLALHTDVRRRAGDMARWTLALIDAPARGDLVEDSLVRAAGLAALLRVVDANPDRYRERRINQNMVGPSMSGTFRAGSPWLPAKVSTNSLRGEKHLPVLPHVVMAGPSPTLRIPSIECWTWDCAWQIGLPHDAMDRMRSETALTELSALAVRPDEVGGEEA
jgi:hypothetical protein